MGLPTSAVLATRGRSIQSGITLEAYPSTVRGLRVEIQSATANSTASSLWSSHIIGPSSGGPLRYTVPIPPSTRAYYFRGRHPAGDGYSNGPFSPVVSARPKLSPEIQRPFVPQITYQGNVEIPSGSDVFVSSGKTMKVGTQPTTATQTRFMRIPAAEFVAENSANSWSVSGAELRSNSTGTSRFFTAPLVLPRGAILRRLQARRFTLSTADRFWARLRNVNSTGTATQLAFAGSTATGATTGYQTVQSSTLAHTVSTGFMYVLDVMLRPSTGIQSVRLQWCEVELAVGSYDKAL